VRKQQEVLYRNAISELHQAVRSSQKCHFEVVSRSCKKKKKKKKKLVVMLF
jgi:hypothetical protein